MNIRRTIKHSLLAGFGWFMSMIAFYAIARIEITGSLIFSFTLGGLMFGFLTVFFVHYLSNRFYKSIIIELDPQEVVLKEAGANHFVGIEGVGGKLVLTDKRLIFKSHKHNVQNHEQSFQLGEIQSAAAGKTMKILNNALLLNLTNGESHRFVVDDPLSWTRLLPTK